MSKDNDEVYKIEKYPIIIGHGVIATLNLYHINHDWLKDLWLIEYEDPQEIAESAAKQLVDRLEDHWTPYFLMSLKKEIIEKLKEHDETFGTKFNDEIM